MHAVRHYPRGFASSALGILVGVGVFAGSAVGLFVLAEQLRDIWLVGRLLALIGLYFAGYGALLITLLLLMAVLGPNLVAKLFLVRSNVLTPEVVHDLAAKEAAPITVPTGPGQGVLRIITVKPDWWLDVAWLPRRNGNPGRRVSNSIRVPEARVGALVFRPSSIPELPGTVEPLDSELAGNLSFFRLGLAAALFVGLANTVWRLAAG